MKYVLVVDDNPSDLMLTSFHVEQQGYIAVKAKNGIDALDIIQNHKYELFIVDLQMPHMNGIELIKRIKRIESVKEVPIFVTSARKEASDVKKAIDSGANDYLVKPIDIQIFEEKFVRLLGSNEEWKEYSIPMGSSYKEASYRKKIEVLSINEIGMTLVSSENFNEGGNVELQSQLLKDLGYDQVLVRVNSSLKKEEYYQVKVSYIGVSEEFRMKIRKFCKKLYL